MRWSAIGVRALVALQGATLDGIELHAPIAGSQFEIGLVEVDAAKHGAYPRELQAEFGPGTYLRSGSFGEAWEATDGGERVVLKLFYRKGADGQITYLTKNNLKREERNAVQEAIQECKLARNIVQFAPAGDPGKKRVVNCRKDRASGRSGDQPLYLVLDHGGVSLEQWIQTKAPRATTLEKRAVVGMLLQGLRTMGELLATPLVHHDLKPANAVYDGASARLIDFGGTMEGTARNRYGSAVATMGYAPPEFLGLVPGRAKVAFEIPAVSYDMYALGMIYAEVMCAGRVQYSDLYTYARGRSKSAATLTQLLRAAGCDISPTDVDAMLPMLAFDATQRPLPSEALQRAPFSRPELRELLKEGRDLAQSESGSEDLAASIVPKDQNNPNVRGGRASIVAVAPDDGLKGWAQGLVCKTTGQKLMRTGDFPSLSNTRQQCEAKCAAYEEAHRAAMYQAMGKDKSQFCCQLNTLGHDGSRRSCEWGFGGLVTHTPSGEHPNAYARVLPFTAPPEPTVRAPAAAPAVREAAQPAFHIGDRVRMMMGYAGESWKEGIVTRTYPELRARPDGWDRDFAWTYVEKLADGPLARSPQPVAQPQPAAVDQGALRKGEHVRMRRAADAAWEHGVVVGWAGQYLVRKNGWPNEAAAAYPLVERFTPAVGATVWYRSRLSAFGPGAALVPAEELYARVPWRAAVVTSSVPLKVHVDGERFEAFVSSDDELELPQTHGGLVRRAAPHGFM